MADKVCCRHSAGLALKGYSLPFWQIAFPVYVLKCDLGTFLVVRRLRFHSSVAGAQVRSLVREKEPACPMMCPKTKQNTNAVLERSPWECAVLLSISCHCHHLRKRCHVSNSDSSKVLGQHFVLTRIWQHLPFYQEQSMSRVLRKLSSRNFTPFHQA